MRRLPQTAVAAPLASSSQVVGRSCHRQPLSRQKETRTRPAPASQPANAAGDKRKQEDKADSSQPTSLPASQPSQTASQSAGACRSSADQREARPRKEPAAAAAWLRQDIWWPSARPPLPLSRKKAISLIRRRSRLHWPSLARTPSSLPPSRSSSSSSSSSCRAPALAR